MSDKDRGKARQFWIEWSTSGHSDHWVSNKPQKIFKNDSYECIHVIEHSYVERLEERICELWNALQEITESGVVDCPECQCHERIAEKAIADDEAQK